MVIKDKGQPFKLMDYKRPKPYVKLLVLLFTGVHVECTCNGAVNTEYTNEDGFMAYEDDIKGWWYL